MDVTRFDPQWDLPEEDFVADVDKQFQKFADEGFCIPTTIQIDPQHPEVIHYYQQTIIHCEKCDARCCLKPITGGKAKGIIKIDKNDLFKIRQRYSKVILKKLKPLLIDIGTGRGFVPPCPYCIDNRCEIYDARPYVCRIYPFGVGRGLTVDGSEFNVIIVDPDCPQAVEYCKNAYLKQYKNYKKS